MELLFPWALAGLALVPAIFLWGLLAPRGRPLVVGSLMLWRRVLGSGPAGKPSARVRLRDPLLWLDAAAVAMLALASAQPAIRTTRPVEPVATIVIDRTAAMAVVPAGKDRPRWRDSSTMVRALTASLGDAPIRVVAVPDASGSASTQTTTLPDLLAQGDAAWSPLPVDRDVWSIAASEAAGRSDRPVIVVTAVSPTIGLPANAYVLAPGGDAADAAIMRAAARVEPDRWWLLVAARSGPGAPPSGLAVEGDGKTLATRSQFPADIGEPGRAAAKSGGVAEEVFAMAGPPPARVIVRLTAAGAASSSASSPSPTSDTASPAGGTAAPSGGTADQPLGDSLAWDDAAYLALGEATHVRITMIGAGDLALRRALEVRDDTDVTVAGAGDVAAALDADILVADSSPIPSGWRGPAVLILPRGTQAGNYGPVHPTGERVQGELGAGEWHVVAEHPLGESLYLEAPQISGVGRFRLDAAAQVLVGTRELPLIVTWEDGGARRLAVLFDIDEPASDWSRRASFPIFWSRAIGWLLPKDRRAAGFRTYAPLEPMAELGGVAPVTLGFNSGAKGAVFGVSFIGSEAGFVSGPGRDDSAAAAEAIRRSIDAGRRAATVAVWPLLAAAALVALVARAWLAR